MPRTSAGHKPENLALGATFTALSFFCVASMSALGKAAGQFTSTGVVVLFQNLTCLVFVLPLVIHNGLASLRTDKLGLHILRAASGTACWYALFFAIKLMPLTNAILLTFSAPLWMPVIAWVAFRQKASAATWIGAALGFVGILLVLGPQHDSFNAGALLALAGALLLAIALMSVRWLGATEPMPRILFYYFLLSTLMAAADRRGRLATVRGAGLDLPARHRICAAFLPGVHRACLPLRVVGQARSARLHRHCLRGADRLGGMGSHADTVRYPRHDAGDRRWACRNSR